MLTVSNWWTRHESIPNLSVCQIWLIYSWSFPTLSSNLAVQNSCLHLDLFFQSLCWLFYLDEIIFNTRVHCWNVRVATPMLCMPWIQKVIGNIYTADYIIFSSTAFASNPWTTTFNMASCIINTNLQQQCNCMLSSVNVPLCLYSNRSYFCMNRQYKGQFWL